MTDYAPVPDSESVHVAVRPQTELGTSFGDHNNNLSERPATRTGLDASAPKSESSVDETLCAAAYVRPGLAEYVRDKLQDRLAIAWAPSTTIDLLALLRHSAAALRIRRLRNVALCALLLLAATVPILLSADLIGPVAAVAMAAALVSAWGYARWRRQRGEPAVPMGRGRRVHQVLVALAAPPALLLLVREPPLWIVAGAFLLAWSVTVAELMWTQQRARLILTRAGDLRGLASSLDPAVEKRIARLAETNVVAYHHARLPTPFVGSGFLVRPWSIDIDVRRGAPGEDGKEKVPEAVDIVALYEFLGARFDVGAVVESGGARPLNAAFRLYADGSRIPWDSDLLTGEPSALRHELEWHDLAARIRQPDSANNQRVYFCLEQIGLHGEIAVALFVQPHLHRGLLTVALFPHVMPPLDEGIEATVATLPDSLTTALRVGTRAMPALVLASPIECAREAWRLVQLYRSRLRWRWAARRRRPRDFGALISLREGVSQTDPRALSHFVTSDLARINADLQNRVLVSVKEFLDRRGIDTRPLEDSAKRTVNSIQNWNFGDVRGDMVSFGHNNTLRYRPGRGDDDDRTETAAHLQADSLDDGIPRR